jgi:hypothetical protein
VNTKTTFPRSLQTFILLACLGLGLWLLYDMASSLLSHSSLDSGTTLKPFPVLIHEGKRTNDGKDSSVTPPDRENVISIEQGHLTARWSQRSLKSVLEDISRQSGIPITISRKVKDSMITRIFDSVPLDVAMRQLLVGHEVKILYGSESAPTLLAVWVYAKGEGQTVDLQSEAQVSLTRLPSEVPSPLSEKANRSTPLEESLNDSDTDKRYQALDNALARGESVSDYLLQRLLLTDPSEHMRLLAFRALVDSDRTNPEDKRYWSETALNDPSKDLQDQAQQLLKQFDESNSIEVDENLPSGTGFGR